MVSSNGVYKHTFASICNDFDKCNDVFLNVLLSDENLSNSSIDDEIRAQVYHANDWQSDGMLKRM